MREKALTATTGVLETAAARQFSPYISLGSSPNARRADRINSVYVATQNASYGWIYEYTPAVRTVIDYVARNIAQLGLKCYERISDDEREHVGDHPAAESMREPNLWTPGQQLIFDLVVDFLVYDNGYILKFQGPGERLTLVNIPPPLVGIVGQSFYQAQAYRIWDQNGGSFDVPAENLFHWRGKDTMDPRRGKSKLETLREEIAADTASRQAVTELYRSGLTAPGWLERPIEAPEISAEGLERLQEDVANQFQSGKRRPPIFEEGMVYKQGGITPEDAELLAARKDTTERIAALYGMKCVPPDSEDDRKQVYADVLSPLTEMLSAFLDLHILKREYNASDHYFQFNLDEKWMSDDRIKTVVSATGGPVYTRDEARALLNLPKLPNGEGEEIITPLNVTVGGKPSPQVMPPQDPNKPPQDGSFRSGEADRPAAAGSQRALEPEIKTLEPVRHYESPTFNGNGRKATPLIPRRRKASERRDHWAGQYEDALTHFFARQEKVTKSKRLKAVTDERWDRELATDLGEIYLRHFETEGKHSAFRLASSFDSTFGHNWLAAKAVGTARDLNRITQEHIEQLGLDEAFTEAKDIRASGAAMAMATDVAGFATKVALEQAPGEGMVTIDGGECEVCAPFQGTWPTDSLEAWPAYHANCTCVADPTRSPGKSLERTETKDSTPIPAQAPVINVTLPEMTIVTPTVQVPEGAIQVNTHSHNPTFIDPAQINVAPAEVHMEPTHVTIAEGAVKAHIEAAPAPNVQVDAPVNVEAPQPANVTIAEGAMKVDVAPADVNVEAPQAPNVHVDVKGGKTTKTIEFSDGRKATVSEEEEDG